MSAQQVHSRRTFMVQSLASMSALGAGVVVGRKLFGDPTQIAARISDAPASHALIPALQKGTQALEALESVKDYRATFAKKELIGRKLIDTQMDLRFREDPFSVYLKFLSPHAGREALFVKGENDDKLLVRDVGFAGLVGTVALDPTGSYAMDENRYPVTMIGMKLMAVTVLEQWLAATKMGGVDANLYPKARIGQTACTAIETLQANATRPAKFHTTRLYLDNETGYPIRVQQYDFPKRRGAQPVLVEDYLYRNIRTNVGLTDMDFNRKNPAYNLS